jgi:hypothetical protein
LSRNKIPAAELISLVPREEPQTIEITTVFNLIRSERQYLMAPEKLARAR